MKPVFYLCALVMLVCHTGYAQVSISTDNSLPDPSAGLDLKFSDKGFLPPRVTSSQMFAISNPAEGLMVYNTSFHALVFYDGTGWKRTDGAHFIGEHYGGGIIFYLDSTEQHGLIATDTDQPMGEFGCYSIFLGGTGTEIGTGQANTTIIVNGCAQPGIAARICDDLVHNGYSDWYLPSRDELVEMHNQREVIGVFSEDFYWTSSECNAGDALSHSFVYNYNYCRGKYDYSHVRAIRSF